MLEGDRTSPDETAIEESSEQPRPSLFHRGLPVLREGAQILVVAFALYLVISSTVVQTNFIEQSSMEATLHEHDRLIAVKCTLGLQLPLMRHRIVSWGTVRRREIILFEPPDRPGLTYVKRIIALPGETIEIHDNQVLINGSTLAESYVRGKTEGRYPPLVVPPDHYYVMGDNRAFSKDSRDFGPVSFRNIQGKALMVYWPSVRVLR